MVQATVTSIIGPEGKWWKVSVEGSGRQLARFRNEDDARAWCHLWNEAEDPNDLIRRAVAGFA